MAAAWEEQHSKADDSSWWRKPAPPQKHQQHQHQQQQQLAGDRSIEQPAAKQKEPMVQVGQERAVLV